MELGSDPAGEQAERASNKPRMGRVILRTISSYLQQFVVSVFGFEFVPAVETDPVGGSGAGSPVPAFLFPFGKPHARRHRPEIP
jgi:hypothetical protein